MSKQVNLKDILLSRTSELIPLETSQKAIAAFESKVPKNLLYDSESSVFEPETVVTSTEIGVRPLSIEETKEFESKINQCIEEIFVEGVHYGSVPGVKKKFLFKAGCEVIISMMGLVARTEVVDKVEDYVNGIFSYTCKTWLIDASGSIRAEGFGICNSKENKYLKQNPYNIQNVLVKLSRKRSITDATLSVSGLSNAFSQDEDLVEVDAVAVTSKDSSKLVSPKQLKYLESLMAQHGTSTAAMDKYVQQNYDVESYKKITASMASEIIEKYKTVG